MQIQLFGNACRPQPFWASEKELLQNKKAVLENDTVQNFFLYVKFTAILLVQPQERKSLKNKLRQYKQWFCC